MGGCFFFKKHGFQAFLEPISVSCCQNSQHPVRQISIGLYRVFFFQKTWFSSIFGAYFRFLLPKFSTSGSSNQHRPLSGVFSSKNMVFKHFWSLFPFPVAKIL